MTIKEFLNKIETYTPDGYTFWSGLHKSAYNQKKTVSDTMLVVFPNPYPSQWKGFCSYDIDVEIWFGKVVNLKNTSVGEYQQDPYSPIDIVSNLHLLADTFATALGGDEYLSLLGVEPYEFFDAPDGQSVNQQVWLKTKIKLRAWFTESPSEIYYVTHTGEDVVVDGIPVIN